MPSQVTFAMATIAFDSKLSHLLPRFAVVQIEGLRPFLDIRSWLTRLGAAMPPSLPDCRNSYHPDQDQRLWGQDGFGEAIRAVGS